MEDIQNFLNLLDASDKKTLKVEISSIESVNISPLSFKQQKDLITTSMDGIIGVMVFIKTLNQIIIDNTSRNDLKIYDRIPLVLALRKELSDKKIEKDDVSIDIDSIISNFKKFEVSDIEIINGDGFEIHLTIPTLDEENKVLAACIDTLRKMTEDSVGNNVSTILSYEIPKFIKFFKIGEKIINMSDISIVEKLKIVNKLPAKITNQITDFILKIREYDEKILSVDGVVIDIDSNLFE